MLESGGGSDIPAHPEWGGGGGRPTHRLSVGEEGGGAGSQRHGDTPPGPWTHPGHRALLAEQTKLGHRGSAMSHLTPVSSYKSVGGHFLRTASRADTCAATPKRGEQSGSTHSYWQALVHLCRWLCYKRHCCVSLFVCRFGAIGLKAGGGTRNDSGYDCRYHQKYRWRYDWSQWRNDCCESWTHDQRHD